MIRAYSVATGLFLALIGGPLSLSARADTISTILGTAGPGNWALLSLGGTVQNDSTTSLTGPGTSTGTFGIASVGELKLSSSVTPDHIAIVGNVYLGNSSTIDHPEEIVGTVFHNQDALLNQAVADAFAATTSFNNLANTFSPGSIVVSHTSSTITAAAALNVADITNLNLDHATLYLSGSAGQQFVFNVSGDFKLNTSDIVLQGGLTSSDVVFNVVGTGSQIAFSGGSSNGEPNSTLNGIILATHRVYGVAPGTINGELIGGGYGSEISLVSGSEVHGGSGSSAPLPAPWAAGGALLAVGGAFRLFRRAKLA